MGWRAVTVRGYVPTANMPDTARVDPHGTLREASALTDHRLLLLVEDEPDVAAFLRDLFELDGWTVEIVAHGRDALARLRECEYRVIVSDLVMPELDGAALYREVARWRPELLPRFIFISGFADTETADFIHQTRAPMISKPFRFDAQVAPAHADREQEAAPRRERRVEGRSLAAEMFWVTPRSFTACGLSAAG